MPWNALRQSFCARTSTIGQPTINLIAGLDARDRDHRFVNPEVRVGGGRDRLRLPWGTSRERWVVQVEHPCVRIQGDVGGAGYPGSKLWPQAEERAQDDVCSREREHRQHTERALSRPRMRQRSPPLPRAEDGALVAVGEDHHVNRTTELKGI